MQKIETLFVRNAYGFVANEVNPAVKEAIFGEWDPRQKLDGVATLLDSHGAWWGRTRIESHEPVPEAFIRMYVDARNGTQWGWIPVSEWTYLHEHRAALLGPVSGVPGTYELLGPGVGDGSHLGQDFELVRHKDAPPIDLPRGTRLTYMLLFDYFKNVLAPKNVEGIVWHGPNSQMAKLKVRDFPLRPAR